MFDVKQMVLDQLKSLTDHVEVVLDTSLFRADVSTKFVAAPTPTSKARLYIYLVSREVST